MFAEVALAASEWTTHHLHLKRCSKWALFAHRSDLHANLLTLKSVIRLFQTVVFMLKCLKPEIQYGNFGSRSQRRQTQEVKGDDAP